jgi:hypothetical protein
MATPLWGHAKSGVPMIFKILLVMVFVFSVLPAIANIELSDVLRDSCRTTGSEEIQSSSERFKSVFKAELLKDLTTEDAENEEGLAEKLIQKMMRDPQIVLDSLLAAEDDMHERIATDWDEVLRIFEWTKLKSISIINSSKIRKNTRKLITDKIQKLNLINTQQFFYQLVPLYESSGVRQPLQQALSVYTSGCGIGNNVNATILHEIDGIYLCPALLNDFYYSSADSNLAFKAKLVTVFSHEFGHLLNILDEDDYFPFESCLDKNFRLGDPKFDQFMGSPAHTNTIKAIFKASEHEITADFLSSEVLADFIKTSNLDATEKRKLAGLALSNFCYEENENIFVLSNSGHPSDKLRFLLMLQTPSMRRSLELMEPSRDEPACSINGPKTRF